MIGQENSSPDNLTTTLLIKSLIQALQDLFQSRKRSPCFFSKLLLKIVFKIVLTLEIVVFDAFSVGFAIDQIFDHLILTLVLIQVVITKH